MQKFYNKLIRDKIPKIIEKNGGTRIAYSMTRKQFEQCAREAYCAIPEHIRKSVDNLALVIKDRPAADMEQDLLGYYIGVPSTEWESAYDLLPDQILLFREPIEAEAAATDGDVARVIRETVWHEVGHFLGIEDDRMEIYEKKWEDAWRSSII